MGVGQFFSFDPTTYRQVVSCYSDDELHREHALTRKKCLGAKASVRAFLTYSHGASRGLDRSFFVQEEPQRSCESD